MKTITKEEYNKLWNKFRLEEWDKIKDSSRAPNGMFGVWGWHLQLEKQFKKNLKNLNIAVEK
jgi:hypothetical protein